MKLQISFETTDLQKALTIASEIADYADIFEIGTLLIYTHGLKALEQFREQFPRKTLLTDSKIIDQAKESVTCFAHAGTDWVTVMAGTSSAVIHAACTAANNLNKKVMLDLLDSSSLGQSAMEAKNLGVDALLFHQPYGEQDALIFLDKWEMVKGNTTLPIYVSANIKRENVQDIIAIKPHGIVIGRSITDASNPVEEAQFFAELCGKN
jgi:3-keto-L-gulonate-6-phosphate decarboxylase